jgi:hypothetical protein
MQARGGIRLPQGKIGNAKKLYERMTFVYENSLCPKNGVDQL